MKKRISKEYELSTSVQNWFVGKKVSNDDENRTINELTNSGKDTLYLFVAAPGEKTKANNFKKYSFILINLLIIYF